MIEFSFESEGATFTITGENEGKIKKRVKLEKKIGNSIKIIFNDVFLSFSIQLQQGRDHCTLAITVRGGDSLPEAAPSFKITKETAQKLEDKFRCDNINLTNKSLSWSP
ncbi:hypothetical protein [Zooshikella harenae]|uniref:Uncharacterized protein n=1 Tax=Zooshikella harenae TaxID=2827238 RepID=A0ABS5Z6V8_9GAMM|nr:hypothetical protein [Zooshikella harenae]MBU2709792.1 hypothetical protein [Zooshikella harenae]